MTAACSHGVAVESWIDFFAGDLDTETGERLEQLLFECAHCAAEAQRWGAIAGGAGIAVPPIITAEALRALENHGEPMSENVMQPGEQREASFPDTGRLLIHRLCGLELSDADRVNLTLVACQRHFGASFPEHIVFEVERCVVDQVEIIAAYTVDHVDWRRS
jgi:hypothetical protein